MIDIKFIGLLLMSIVLTVSCHSSAATCPNLFADSDWPIRAELLHRQISGIGQTLSDMVIGSDLPPVEYLGHGMTGSVFKVQYKGSFYALKLIGFPSKTHLESVPIQKLMGDLGYAPRVVGVLLPRQIGKWIRKYGAQFEMEKARPGLGILMELTETQFLSPMKKPHGSKKIKITHQEYEKLLLRIHAIAEALYFFKIAAWDSDAVIVQGNGLLLVDLNEYKLWKESDHPSLRGTNAEQIYENLKRYLFDENHLVEIVTEQ